MPALALGAREGALLIDPDTGTRLASFRFAATSEFGFNSVGILEEDRTLLATHSDYGAVSWKLDGDAEPRILAKGLCRSLVVLSTKLRRPAAIDTEDQR